MSVHFMNLPIRIAVTPVPAAHKQLYPMLSLVDELWMLEQLTDYIYGEDDKCILCLEEQHNQCQEKSLW